MSLYDDIKKVTSINWIDNDIQFLRLQGSSQAEKDRKMNERKMKKPQNIHLVETSDKMINDDDTDNIDNEIKFNFNEHEVSAAIKEVNGGADLSNKYWEEYWSKQLQDMISPEKKIKTFSRHNDIKTHSENHSKDKDLCRYPIKNINPNNRLYRNAAIMSLVKLKKISLEDISDPNTSFVETKNKLDALHEISVSASTDIINNAQYQLESVPLPDNPEVFVHPLQIGLNSKEFKHINFTLPRLGKKVKVTPSEYFLARNDDELFGFVKKKKNVI